MNTVIYVMLPAVVKTAGQMQFLVNAADEAAATRRQRARRRKRWQTIGLRVVSVLSILGIWWLVTALEIWKPLILPSPAKVWDAFIQSVTTDGRRRGLSGHFLWEHLGASLERIAKGVAAAIVIGPPLGLLLASVRPLRLIVEPWISFLRALPPLGYFPLLILWFGIYDTSKIWLLFLAAFPPITLATFSGVERVRQDRIDAARSLGASRWQVVRVVVLPSAVPDIITGIRVALGFAWTTIVAAETSNGIPGIGGLAWATQKELRTDVSILCIIVIGTTAVVLDQLILAAERALVPWKGRA
jgi:taurine transport system permease protein